MQEKACRQELRKAHTCLEKPKWPKPESHMCSWRNESQKDCLVSLSLSCVLAQKNTFHFKTPSYLGDTCCWEQLKSQCKTTTLPDRRDKEHTGNHVQLVNRFEKAPRFTLMPQGLQNHTPCTVRAFILKAMRILRGSLMAISLAHTCRQRGRPDL